MTDECWKIIDDYPNYMISNHGRVLNWKRGRILKPNLNEKGYYKNKLCLRGSESNLYVHRLVASAFVPNPCGYHLVDHQDDDPTNNYYKNLIWCDSQYNNEKSSSKVFVLMSPSGEKVEVYNMPKFCRDNNLLQGNMAKLGKTRNSHRGWSLWE